MKPSCPSRTILSSKALAVFLVMMGEFLGAVQGAQILRGPYLQMGTPQEITIRWRTDEPTASVVYHGEDPAFLYELAGNLEPTTEHEVRLYGLSPGTRRYYSVGTLFETLAGGPEFSFVTAPALGSRNPIRIWAVGDCGTKGLSVEDHQEKVRDAFYEWADRRPADLWLALGDNAYYYGEDEEYQTQFFDVYPRLLRSTVLWPTIGNHETYSSEAETQLPYFRIFSLPTRGEAGGVPSGTENYYSFNHGNIHFVCLDSEIMIWQPGGPMLRWLQADLAANTSDWVIAFWHTPPYSKGSHDSDVEFALMQMRTQVVPILEAYGVDLVLSGHSHIYERSYLLRGHYGKSPTLAPRMILDAGSGQPSDTGAYRKSTTGPTAQQGTVYVVAGSGGWATYRNGFHPAMYHDELETGSLVIDVEGDRLDLQFLRETGAVDDSFTILKSNAPEPLRIVRLQTDTKQMTFSFRTVAGHRYHLEQNQALGSDLWEKLGEPIEATSALSKVTLPAFRESGAAFFRVVEDPPTP